jgi:hypothetical protein
MLGGECKSTEITRDITEIEEQVLEGVIRIMCRELQTSWQAISLQFNFGARQQILQTQRLMPPDEKKLCLSFEIKMSETRGTLNLAVPAVVSNALLRKIAADFSYQRPRGPIEARLQIQKKLLNCLFPVELSMPGLQVPLQSLSDCPCRCPCPCPFQAVPQCHQRRVSPGNRLQPPLPSSPPLPLTPLQSSTTNLVRTDVPRCISLHHRRDAEGAEKG